MAQPPDAGYSALPDRRDAPLDRSLSSLRIARGLLFWVKNSKAQNEQIFSGCPRSGPPWQVETTSHDNLVSSLRKDRRRGVDARTSARGPPRDAADRYRSLDAESCFRMRSRRLRISRVYLRDFALRWRRTLLTFYGKTFLLFSISRQTP